jgi:alpha-beta hydrolase superfamily lysophospholipase
MAKGVSSVIQNRSSRWVRVTVVAAVAVVAAGAVFASWAQRSKPELSPWHTVDLEHEFDARDARSGFDWDDYLALEDLLFEELEEQVVRNRDARAEPAWNRYAPGGANNPAGFPRNWNRSYELPGVAERGGALLLHGLTDSPYSLRRAAEILRSEGFHVVGLRLPGHGTTPGELQRAEVDDWRAAVRMAYRHLEGMVGSSGDLIVVGYSNGGALAVDLVLDSLADDELRIPDRVILFSPAIGITRLAALARAHRVVSFMPWFSRLAWTDIQPESDPFKYNSFPADAGYQTHLLTRSIRRRLAELEAHQLSSRFPPVLTFMSLADATVLVEAVVEGLYDRLTGPEHELVIFDINRKAKMRDFFRTDPAARLQMLIERPTTPYRLTAVTNVDESTAALEVWTRPGGAREAEVEALGLEWPRGVYSLSHVAVPFPIDDPIYGLEPDPDNLFGVQLGTLEPRGERGLLAVSPATFIRLRCNPFYDYVERRLREPVGAHRVRVSSELSGQPTR